MKCYGKGTAEPWIQRLRRAILKPSRQGLAVITVIVVVGGYTVRSVRMGRLVDILISIRIGFHPLIVCSFLLRFLLIFCWSTKPVYGKK